MKFDLWGHLICVLTTKKRKILYLKYATLKCKWHFNERRQKRYILSQHFAYLFNNIIIITKIATKFLQLIFAFYAFKLMTGRAQRNQPGETNLDLHPKIRRDTA